MKNLVTAVLLLTLPSLVFSQSVNYTVKGKITNITGTAKAYLLYKKDGRQITDSTLLQDGAFEFKGVAEMSTQAWLDFDEYGYITLYLDGPVDVYSPDSLDNVVVKGGKLNDDHSRLKEALKPNDEKLSIWRKAYAALPKGNEKEKETIMEQRKELLKEREALQTNFIKNNPKSPICIDIITVIGGFTPDIDKIEALFNSLSKEVKESKKGQQYILNLKKEKAIAIGAIAPDFTQPDTAGNPVSLRDLKGKYVLLDFWASWCGPCRAENPNLVKAYNAYKNKNFTILAVSLDEGENGKKAWLTAIKKDGLTWTHVSDLQKSWNNEVVQLYQVKGVPQNFLIDPNGKIIARDLRGENLEKKLSELLDGQ